MTLSEHRPIGGRYCGWREQRREFLSVRIGRTVVRLLRHLGGVPAPTAEALMRSRYTAYALLDEAYLLATWHRTTRPQSLRLAQDIPPPRWLGRKVLDYQLQDESHATVEFVARQKIAGRAYRLHEVSRFVLTEGRRYYLDGDIAAGQR